jgi:hypothetical protein
LRDMRVLFAATLALIALGLIWFLVAGLLHR